MLLIPKYTVFPDIHRQQYFGISQIVFPGTLAIKSSKKKKDLRNMFVATNFFRNS